MIASAGPAIAPAVIAAISGVGGALVGGLATNLAARRTAKDQRALAADDRTQQRQGDTYVALMSWVNWTQNYADAVHQGLLVSPAPPLPADPTGLADIPSRVRAFASARVATKTVQLIEAFDGFTSAVANYEAQKTAGAIPIDIRPVDRAHQDVGRIGDELEDLVRDDLRMDPLPRSPRQGP